MTSIQATINSQDFGSAAKRLDVWHEGGGIGRWERELDNSSGGSQILATNYPATNLGIRSWIRIRLSERYVNIPEEKKMIRPSISSRRRLPKSGRGGVAW